MSSPSRAIPSITRPTGSCASTAAGRAGTTGRRSPKACRSATAMSTCCATRWRSTRSMRAASISAPRAGRCTCRPMPGTTGRPSCGISRPCCRSRSRPCGDPRRAPAASAHAGPRAGRGAATLSISTPLARRVCRQPRGEKTMRFMILVKANKDSEAGVLPDEKALSAMGKFNEELAKAGVLLAAEGLQASAKGARVKFSGNKRTVTDGPFAETKELIAGFWLWQVKSQAEADAWIKRAPFDGGTEIEVRQVFDANDLGDSFTPELRAQEDKIRAELGRRG